MQCIRLRRVGVVVSLTEVASSEVLVAVIEFILIVHVGNGGGGTYERKPKLLLLLLLWLLQRQLLLRPLLLHLRQRSFALLQLPRWPLQQRLLLLLLLPLLH